MQLNNVKPGDIVLSGHQFWMVQGKRIGALDCSLIHHGSIKRTLKARSVQIHYSKRG